MRVMTRKQKNQVFFFIKRVNVVLPTPTKGIRSPVSVRNSISKSVSVFFDTFLKTGVEKDLKEQTPYPKLPPGFSSKSLGGIC